MTNLVFAVTNKLAITAAYKSVALAVMLTNSTEFLERVRLPSDMTNLVAAQCTVNPPRLMGFGGSIVTQKYFFGFGHGHLANFWQSEFRSGEGASLKTQQRQWAQMTSQVGTNEARHLALLWLADLRVDTAELERKYPCSILQRFFYQGGTGQLIEQSAAKVMLPVFDISWGSIPLAGRPEYTMPAASMTIFGPTSELIEYHLYADALMLRKLEVQDFEKLLAIPDENFSRYDETQRSNLVRQFTAKLP